MRSSRKNFLFGCGALVGLGLALRIPPSTPPSLRITAERLQQSPLIAPEGEEAAAGTFNPAAVRYGNEIILLYREQDSAKAG